MSDQSIKQPQEKFATEAEWLAARRNSIGGSDAATILEQNQFSSPLELYAEKLGLVEPSEVGQPARWGKRLEPAIAAGYTEETGRQLVDHGYHLFKSADYPWAHATIDRQIILVDNKPGPGVYEAKLTGYYKKSEIEADIPIVYQIQVQHNIAVLGLEWGSVAILLNGRELLWADLERNDRFIEVLMDKEREFWDRVQTQQPPPPGPSKSARETLGKLYPQDTGATIVLPLEAYEWDRRRTAAKEALKKAEAECDEAENMIKAALGDATVGVFPDGVGRFTWKSQTRKAYSVAETSMRILRRATK